MVWNLQILISNNLKRSCIFIQNIVFQSVVFLNPKSYIMKTNLRRLIRPLWMAACIYIALFGLPLAGSSQTAACNDPENVIYGNDQSGKIYPITVGTSTVGTALNASGTINTPSSPNGANGLGYTNINGKFYYFWKNPSSSNGGTFVSYDPVTKTYATLAASPIRNAIRTGSVSSDGRYYTVDTKGNLYCYTISTNSWKLITSSLVDQDGNDVSASIQTFNTGDMAFDGYGNIWLVTAGQGKIGLYKISGPVPSTGPLSSLPVTRILATTTPTPDGNDAYGIAFNQSGNIYISTSNHLYLFNPITLTFTLKGSLANSIVDLTSCNFPMNVMPLKWLSFNVQAKNKNQIYLNWQVSTQVNNKGFYVQYSRDQSKWDNLAYIPSRTVTSLDIEQYTYSYLASLSASNFYRVKQEDIDGQSSYSWIRVLNSNPDNPVIVYPNPARDELNIVCSDQTVTQAQIVDLSGRLIKNFNVRPGENKLDISIIKSGVYFISVNQSDGKRNMVKMVKQ